MGNLHKLLRSSFSNRKQFTVVNNVSFQRTEIKLTVSLQKMSYMITASRTIRCDPFSIVRNNTELLRVPTVKYLGVYVDGLIILLTLPKESIRMSLLSGKLDVFFPFGTEKCYITY